MVLPHTGEPVVQEIAPALHLLGLAMQLMPELHAAQVPAGVQTWFVPQLDPGESLLAPSTHTALPVVQEVTPCLHAVGLVVQVPPAVQLPQFPLAHTWPFPHAVPLARLVVVSVHTAAPVAHDTRPVLHGLGLVVQAVFSVQLTHAPFPSHTRLVPQVVPAFSLPVSSMQIAAPVVHETMPSLQWPGLVLQLEPLAQAEQTPPLQN